MEREARRRSISVSAALDLAARDWLRNSGAETGGEEEQLRLRQAASKCFGNLASGDAHRAETAPHALRQRLRRRYGR